MLATQYDLMLRPNYTKQAYIAILESGRVVSVPFAVIEEYKTLLWDDGSRMYTDEDIQEVLSDAMSFVDLGY